MSHRSTDERTVHSQGAHAAPRRRSRPLRRLLIIASLLVIALLASMAWVVVDMAHAKPGAAVNYRTELQTLARKGEPADGLERYPITVKLHELAKKLRAEFPQGGARSLEFSDLASASAAAATNSPALASLKQADAYLVQNGAPALLDELRTATRSGWTASKHEGLLLNLELPQYGSLRLLARWCSARQTIAWNEGRQADAITELERGLALGRGAEDPPVLIGSLVEVAICSLNLGVIREAAVNGLMSADSIERVAKSLDSINRRPIQRGLIGERLFAMDFIQDTHTDDGRGSGVAIPSRMAGYLGSFGGAGMPGLASSRWLNFTGLFMPRKKAQVDTFTSLYDRVDALVSVTRGERQDTSGPGLLDHQIATSSRNMLVGMLMPALGKAVGSQDQMNMELDATRLVLAIELHRQMTGLLPKTLDDIPAATLARARATKTDPFNGKSFGYLPIDPAKDALGRDYLVYTFGGDNTDDKGVEDSANRWVAINRTPAPTGVDFVITQERVRRASPPQDPPK